MKRPQRWLERVGTVMREARERQGITQVTLAKKLRKSQSYISKYENGERRLDLVEFFEITRAIGADPRELVGQMF